MLLPTIADEEVSINMSRFMYELESVLGTTGLGAGPTEDSLADNFDNSDSDMESSIYQFCSEISQCLALFCCLLCPEC